MLGRLLGIGVEYRFMEPFGFINTVDLVGVGPCNNPFYGNPVVTGGKITGSDEVHYVRLPFGNHAFAKYGGNIYDACAGPHTGSCTEAQYLSTVIDKSTKREEAFAGTVTNIHSVALIGLK